MSLVYITYHDENIFDVDKDKDYCTTREKLKYTSKFRKMVKEEKQARHIVELPDRKKLLTSSSKNNHQTMGYAQTPVEMPDNFLKKNNGVKWQRLNEHRCPPKKEIPPIPQFSRSTSNLALNDMRKELPKKEKDDLVCPHTKYFKGHEHRANFVAINVDLIKNLKSKKPLPRYVDTPKGDRHNLLNSGLVPQYICSKNFAKVPCYLNARKKFLTKLNVQCENSRLEAENACLRYADRFPGVRKLTLDERQDILKGLKANFAELFKAYQSLSLYTDTVAKKLHKSKLENDLRQLEQDIYLMDHNPEIYVSEY